MHFARNLHTKWSESCSVVSDSLRPHELGPTTPLSPWNSPGKNTGMGCHFLLQGIFLTQGSNPCFTRTIVLSNSVKKAMPCGATQDGWVMVERSDRMWSIGEGNGKPLPYSCLENPMNSMKRQNNRILKEELPRSVGAQYATGDQWRNNSRKNEGMEPKQKQHPVVDMTSDRSKVWCCKERYCIGTWNVRSMNQGKLEVVKQEMATVNVNILGISELKWTSMSEFNPDNHFIYYYGEGIP